MKGFWQGRNSPPRQFVVNPWGWPLALPSVPWLCWLPSQLLHPSACLREELLKFIAALTHQLETCQAAYIFTTIIWALIPEGASRQDPWAQTVLHNCFLMCLIHLGCWERCISACTATANCLCVRTKRPLVLFSSVRYSWACGTNTEHPSTERMKQQNSRSTADLLCYLLLTKVTHFWRTEDMCLVYF